MSENTGSSFSPDGSFNPADHAEYREHLEQQLRSGKRRRPKPKRKP